MLLHVYNMTFKLNFVFVEGSFSNRQYNIVTDNLMILHSSDHVFCNIWP